ncbi:MAG TPA: RHS repeat-associated core domain-containing protein [Gemmatirosa sp.]
MSCLIPPGIAHRLVGDPIDAITGASSEIVRDFRLPAPIALNWRRHNDSARVDVHGALGWGHAHEYERTLQFDLDGIRYMGPLSQTVAFPPLACDGATAAAGGLVLRRVGALRYAVAAAGEPTMVFEFANVDRPCPITALVHGRSRLRFAYRADGALAAIDLSDGRVVRAECDGFRHVCALTLMHVDGRTRELVRYRYDEAGNMVHGVDAYRHPFTYEYDRAHRIVQRTDRRGYAFRFAYDALGRCVASEGVDGLHAVRLEFRPDERHTRVTQADGGVWTYWHDERQLLTAIIDPYGGARTFAYDDRGRVAEEKDPNGDVTRWLYDASGRYVGKRSSLGDVALAGESVFRPDQRAHRVPSSPAEWEWGDLIARARRSVPDAVDAAEATELPGVARRLVALVREPDPSTPAAPEYVAEECDDLGARLRAVAADGRARRWGYDAGGNTLRYADFDGSVVECEYGSWDLAVRRTDALGRALTRQFTTSAQVAAVVDPGGVRTAYVYDLAGRVTEFWYDGACAEQYRYDVAGNLVATLDGAGGVIATQEYGEQNLRVARRLATGETHRFAYTPRGEYAAVATDEARVTFDYDVCRNRTQDARDGRGVAHAFEGPGHLVCTTVLDRFATRYRRPTAGTLEITDPGGQTHLVQISADGTVVRRMSSGLLEVARYADAGRCLARASAKARATAYDTPWVRRFGYSGEGDLVEVQDSAAGVTRYAYDAAHRLTEMLAPDGTRAAFQHDAGDNLLAQPGLAGVAFAGGHRLWWANGNEFAYDACGNVAERRGSTRIVRYRYDARNMLVACDTPAGEWRAVYDPLGRRIRTSLGDTWREFFWDTDRLAAELRHDGRLRIYVYADAFAIVPLLWLDYDAPDADPASGRRYFVRCDHRGTPVRVEDEGGEAAWRAEVAPYGAAVVRGGARVEMPLRFPGHYYDVETGLHYNRFRYYSPELGRYLQPDPLRTAAATNWYAYTTNPLREVDVRGDCPVDGTTPLPAASDEGGTVAADPEPAAPRVVPLDEAIATVNEALDTAGVGLGRVKAFGVSTHEDGTVTVAYSGNQASVESAQARVKLPPNYNNAPSEVDTSGFEAPPPREDGKRQSDSSTCVEPRQAAGERANGSPVVERTDNPVWRGDPADNPHPRTAPDGTTDGTRMNPCDSCNINKTNM